MQCPEPNIDIASQWWPDLDTYWTALGWKDHPFRFNVLYDGTLLVDPQRHFDQMAGRTGAQFTFIPVLKVGDQLGLLPGRDDHMVRQGWNDSNTPVLWSEWSQGGLLLRQEVFAHLPGGQLVETGREPLFAWIRLSIHDVCEGIYPPKQAGFAIKINAPFVIASMQRKYTLRYAAEKSTYETELRPSGKNYSTLRGYSLNEDGNIRLVIPPGQQCHVTFMPSHPTEHDTTIYVMMDATKGTHVDLLVPLFADRKAVVSKELKLGRDAAFAEAARFWSDVPATAAVFSVPETYINTAIQRSLQATEIIAEKSPVAGDYSLLSGSWVYGLGLWATPATIALNFLDIMGYHDDVERYLQIFRTQQGTVKPPGSAYHEHPGYLTSPRSLTSVDWLADHGALLWAISSHALLTGDKRFIDEWLPGIVKACEFIQDSRRIDGHGGITGILPPAIASDQGVEMQAIWSDGWNYKGLVTTVRLLTQLDHPRAAEFEAEAAAYRTEFMKAFSEQTALMPTWRDDKGEVHHQLPTALTGQRPWQLTHPFHLDTGPLFLVFAGLMDATDPLMQSTLAWFREGPQTRMLRHDACFDQPPCLVHEMSSAEPCYTWSVFHTWQTGDRVKYLEGMYSLFTGAMSRQTYSCCETRGGIMATTHWLMDVLLARLSVIDDLIRSEELHLLRLVPLAWLQAGKEARFERMPTEFGPVTLTCMLANRGKTLRIAFKPQYRTLPKRVVLHIPPLQELEVIMLNGRRLEWNGRTQEIEIPILSPD
jgi:hypothetical protein